MKRLTNEEVLHVAKLARLKLTEEEVEKYAYQLKSILDEINKINDIELEQDKILISPTKENCNLRNDEESYELETEQILKNVPNKFDKFVEVRGVFDE